MMLLCNVVSHWLGLYPESSLEMQHDHPEWVFILIDAWLEQSEFSMYYIFYVSNSKCWLHLFDIGPKGTGINGTF